MNLTKIGRQFGLALVALTGLASSSQLLAQEEEAGWLNVRVIEVKPDRAAEWEELQQERNAAIKKAGAPGRDIWQVARGDVDTYHIVTVVPKLSANDQPGTDPMGEVGFARWVSRVNQCVGHRQVLTVRRMPELNIPPKEGRDSNLTILSLRTNAPARGRDYFNYLKDEYVPALKKAGVDGVSFNRIFAGDSARTWVVATRIDNWAAFDGPNPITDALGEEEARKLILKGAAMIEHAETVLLSYRADLSVR